MTEADQCPFGAKRIMDELFVPLLNVNVHLADYKNYREVNTSILVLGTAILTVVVIVIGLFYILGRSVNLIQIHTRLCETRKRLCVRIFLNVLLLLVLTGLCYTTVDAYRAHKDIARFNNILEKDQEEAQMEQKAYKDFMFKQREDLEQVCLANMTYTNKFNADKSKLTRYIENIHNPIVELNYYVLDWSDFIRLFHRNMLTFISSTMNGTSTSIPKEFGFETFHEHSLKFDTLSKISRTFRVLRNLVAYIEKRVDKLYSVPKTLYSNTSMNYILSDIGNEPGSLNAKYVRSIERKTHRPINNFTIIFNSINLYIAISIIISAFLAFCFGVFGGRSKEESFLCCNHQTGSILFETTAFIGLVAFAYIGFFAFNSLQRALSLYHFECKQKYTSAPSPIKQVDFPIFDDSSLPLLQSVYVADTVMGNGSLCNELEIRVNIPRLKQLHDSLYVYTNLYAPNSAEEKEKAMCDLRRLQTTRIENFPESQMLLRMNHIGNKCRLVNKIFNEGLRVFFDQFLREISEKEYCYRWNIEEFFHAVATDRAAKLESAQLTNIECAENDSEREYEKCKMEADIFANYWRVHCEMLLLILLLLPLLLWLSRTYPCSTVMLISGSDEENNDNATYWVRLGDLYAKHVKPLQERFSFSAPAPEKKQKRKSTVHWNNMVEVMRIGSRESQKKKEFLSKTQKEINKTVDQVRKQKKDQIKKEIPKRNSIDKKQTPKGIIKKTDVEKQDESRSDGSWFGKLDFGTILKGNNEVNEAAVEVHTTQVQSDHPTPSTSGANANQSGGIWGYISNLTNTVNYDKLVIGNWEIGCRKPETQSSKVRKTKRGLRSQVFRGDDLPSSSKEAQIRAKKSDVVDAENANAASRRVAENKEEEPTAEKEEEPTGKNEEQHLGKKEGPKRQQRITTTKSLQNEKGDKSKVAKKSKTVEPSYLTSEEEIVNMVQNLIETEGVKIAGESSAASSVPASTSQPATSGQAKPPSAPVSPNQPDKPNQAKASSKAGKVAATTQSVTVAPTTISYEEIALPTPKASNQSGTSSQAATPSIPIASGQPTTPSQITTPSTAIFPNQPTTSNQAAVPSASVASGQTGPSSQAKTTTNKAGAISQATATSIPVSPNELATSSQAAVLSASVASGQPGPSSQAKATKNPPATSQATPPSTPKTSHLRTFTQAKAPSKTAKTNLARAQSAPVSSSQPTASIQATTPSTPAAPSQPSTSSQAAASGTPTTKRVQMPKRSTAGQSKEMSYNANQTEQSEDMEEVAGRPLTEISSEEVEEMYNKVVTKMKKFLK